MAIFHSYVSLPVGIPAILMFWEINIQPYQLLECELQGRLINFTIPDETINRTRGRISLHQNEPLNIQHSHGKSTINGGFSGKIIYKWVITIDGTIVVWLKKQSVINLGNVSAIISDYDENTNWQFHLVDPWANLCDGMGWKGCILWVSPILRFTCDRVRNLKNENNNWRHAERMFNSFRKILFRFLDDFRF